MSDLAASLLRRHERMKTDRQTQVEAVWRECFDYTYPIRGNGLSGAIGTAMGNQAKQARLFDGTAPDSAGVLAANIMAGMTPANALWFGLSVGHETPEEQRWLDESALLLWENIHMSNFDADGFEGCLDVTIAGQFLLYIDEDRERGGLVFQHWPLAECYATSTRADGRVDVVHREFELTAEAAEREYGINALPETIRKALEAGKLDERFRFVHAIYPRTPHAVGAKLAKNLPIASCHLELGSKVVVRESGYHEMPVVVPRWLRVPGSSYAVGPLYGALPDVRQVNEFKAADRDSAELAISGMWLGVDDGILNPRNIKLGPKKVVVAADKDSLTPLQTGADFNLADSKIAQLQGAIRKTMMADQLVPQDGPQMTAEEVRTRVDMIRRLLGPWYGRLQAEYLRPLIERCFGLAFRAGIFAPPPQSLRGRLFSVQYASPMARAQKLDEVDAIRDTVADCAQMAATDPTIMDEIDLPKALELIAKGRGAPASIRRSDKDKRALQQARAQAQQASQAQTAATEAQAVGMQEAAKRAATR